MQRSGKNLDEIYQLEVDENRWVLKAQKIGSEWFPPGDPVTKPEIIYPLEKANREETYEKYGFFYRRLTRIEANLVLFSL